jgi:hypothetical protein
LSVWTSQALSGVVVTSGGIDLVTAAAASVVLMLTGLSAVLPAARRAARTDPLTALRADT